MKELSSSEEEVQYSFRFRFFAPYLSYLHNSVTSD